MRWDEKKKVKKKSKDKIRWDEIDEMRWQEKRSDR